jgi:hypothetical protein
MCADLGARTTRAELDAMRFLGIQPIRALVVVPRLLAATLVSILPNSIVVVGITAGFMLSLFVQNGHPGAVVAGMTLLTGLPEILILLIEAAVRVTAGLIACYKGISVGGGPAGVGNAVNKPWVRVRGALSHQRGGRGRRGHDVITQSWLSRLDQSANNPRFSRARCTRSVRPSYCRGEMRLVAQMSFGTGALAMIGGVTSAYFSVRIGRDDLGVDAGAAGPVTPGCDQLTILGFGGVTLDFGACPWCRGMSWLPLRAS